MPQGLDLSDWVARTFRGLMTPAGIGLAVGFALLFCVATGLAVPWVLRRLPADALEKDAAPSLRVPREPGRRLWLRVLKNLLGATLVVAGIAMLVLPGQGLLTLIAGLILLEIPGKWRVIRAVLGASPVLRAVNRYRTGRGLEPLRTPTATRQRRRGRS